MTAKAKPLAKILVRDIMRTDVVKLDPAMPLEEAVASFAELHISGAPVVDRAGRLVGVLSAFDIAKPENMRDGSVTPRSNEYALGDASPDDDGSYDGEVVFSMEDYSPEVLRRGTVSDLMSNEVICVSPDAPLKDVCATMVKEHIHRVMVTEETKLVGIVTSLDVVRCVATAL